jgi:hypothetical protein
MAILAAASLAGAAMAQNAAPDRTLEEMIALMADAQARGASGIARKKATKPVDARPARVGEVVVTVIKGEGKETQSRPARQGDWVVRNRTVETGHEQYLVGAKEFEERYQKSGVAPEADGWQEFRPAGKRMRFYILPPDTKAFTFVAPWGESMVARPGDTIAQDPENEKDVYRIAAAAFADTYEIVQPPAASRP